MKRHHKKQILTIFLFLWSLALIVRAADDNVSIPLGDSPSSPDLKDLDPAKVAMMSQYQKRELFREANALYYQEDFDQAARIYSVLIDAGVRNEALYFNAGNAFYKNGAPGQAVWYYEKALRLAPRDEHLQVNLKQVSPPENHRRPFVLLRPFVFFSEYFSLTESILLVSVFWWMALIVLSVSFFFRPLGRPRIWARRLAGIGFSLFFVFALIAGAKTWNQSFRPWAILMTSNAQGATAPREDAPRQFQESLPAGWRVLVLKDLAGGWSEIRLPDGNRTYVRSDDIRRL